MIDALGQFCKWRGGGGEVKEKKKKQLKPFMEVWGGRWDKGVYVVNEGVHARQAALAETSISHRRLPPPRRCTGANERGQGGVA